MISETQEVIEETDNKESVIIPSNDDNTDEVDEGVVESSSLLHRQNTYTVSQVSKVESKTMVQERFSETCHRVDYQYDQEEPHYKEPDDALNDETDLKQTEETVEKKEDAYVTAEEVRNQKHKLQMSSANNNDTQESHVSNVARALDEDTSREPTVMEETSLSSIAAARKQSRSVDDMSRTSREVEQLISDIRDPELDCSLEDIAAMIEDKGEVEKKQSRVSPEFATAVTMIDKVKTTIL